MGFVDVLDRTQRRHSIFGFPTATFYKFFDDQGPYLSAIISFYGLLAIFPLLLLSVTIFGFILQGNPGLQDSLLNTALGTFPIIGDELGRPERLTGSTFAIVVGIVTATYGSLGLGQAIQNALNVAWSVPRNKRPNPVRLRLRSLLLLVVAGTAILAITVVSVIGSEIDLGSLDRALGWAIRLLTVVLIGLLLTVVFRLAAARRHHLGSAAPGAFTVAILWQGLQYVGTVYTTRVIGETQGMNSAFGVFLGLIGIIYVASLVGVFGIEVNVVLTRRLWPRSVRSLFVDGGDLTDADRRAYASYVRSNMHKTAENVAISFEDPVTGELTVVDDGGPKGHFDR